MSEAEPVACPACAGRVWSAALRPRDMFTGAAHALERCAGCGLLHTRAGSGSRVAVHAPAGRADAGERFVGPLEPLMRWLKRRRLTLVTAGRAPGRVLDVGCGRGELLAALAEQGWQVWGTELDEAIAATARATLGERLLVGELERLDLGALRFDLVTFWHVLEHLPDPQAALARAAALLAPGGAVLVAVPNVDSWQARLGGERWLHLDVPRHLWHFTPATLCRAAERAGLAHVATEQFSLEYGPYGAWQTALARLGFGHRLFTEVLRAGSPAEALRRRSLWAHLAAAPLLASLAGGAFALELLAARAGAGGAITCRFARREDAR